MYARKTYDVIGLIKKSQIGHDVFDFFAVEEAEATKNFVWDLGFKHGFLKIV